MIVTSRDSFPSLSIYYSVVGNRNRNYERSMMAAYYLPVAHLQNSRRRLLFVSELREGDSSESKSSI
jgi:hypothetical protein